MVSAPPKPNDSTGYRHGPNIPPKRGYSQRGGRPGLNVDFVAVCDAVGEARNGSGETITSVQGFTGMVTQAGYPAPDDGVPRVAKDDRVIETRTHW